MEANSMITIGFTFTNEFGHTFEAKSTLEAYPDLGIDELATIGEQLDAFLRQIGYARNGGMVFMESVTQDEMEYLGDCLDEYRDKKKEKDNVQNED